MFDKIKIRFIYVFLILSFLLSCTSNKDTIPINKPLKKELQIDDCNNEKTINTSYKNDSIGISDFCISPIDSNYIWTFNSNGYSYELSLKDSSWKNLKYFLKEYSFGLRRNDINKDAIDSNLIWICNFHKGLIAYNRDNKKITEFNSIKNISKIVFSRKTVFVGTSNGLYSIFRKNNEIRKINEVPQIWINSLKIVESNSIIINNKYKYNFIKDKLKKINGYSQNEQIRKEKGYELKAKYGNTLIIEKNGKSKKIEYQNNYLQSIVIDDSCLWLPSDRPNIRVLYKINIGENSIDTIHTNFYLHNPKTINDNNLIWFYNNNSIYDNILVYFNKLDKTLKHITLNYRINKVYINNCVVYINSWHSINIYSKKELINKAVNIKVINNELDLYKGIYDSLKVDSDTSIEELYNDYKIIKNRFNNTDNQYVKNQIKNIEMQFIWKDTLTIKDTSVINSINEQKIKADLYNQLTNYAIYNGKLNEAILYGEILINEYPMYTDNYFKEKIKAIKLANKRKIEIEKANYLKDKELWLIGNVYYNLFSKYGPPTECSGMNMTIPFSFYKKIIRKYPKSQYIDNCEFAILSNKEAMSHEGGDNSYNLTAIKKYKRILQKYPETDIKVDILARFVDLYYMAETDSLRIENHKLSLKYAKKIITEYPNYKNINSIKERVKHIERSLQDISWKFAVSAKKKVFRIGEPIHVTFSLVNVYNKEQKIKILDDKNISNFILRVKYYPKTINGNINSINTEIIYVNENIKKFNHSSHFVTLKSKEEYKEVWDILKNTRNNFKQNNSILKIDKKGFYKIESFFTVDGYSKIRSNTLWIETIE